MNHKSQSLCQFKHMLWQNVFIHKNAFYIHSFQSFIILGVGVGWGGGGLGFESGAQDKRHKNN